MGMAIRAFDPVSDIMAELLREALADTVADMDADLADEVLDGKIMRLDQIAERLGIPLKTLFVCFHSRMRAWHNISIGYAHGVVLVPKQVRPQ